MGQFMLATASTQVKQGSSISDAELQKFGDSLREGVEREQANLTAIHTHRFAYHLAWNGAETDPGRAECERLFQKFQPKWYALSGMVAQALEVQRSNGSYDLSSNVGEALKIGEWSQKALERVLPEKSKFLWPDQFFNALERAYLMAGAYAVISGNEAQKAQGMKLFRWDWGQYSGLSDEKPDYQRMVTTLTSYRSNFALIGVLKTNATNGFGELLENVAEITRTQHPDKAKAVGCAIHEVVLDGQHLQSEHFLKMALQSANPREFFEHALRLGFCHDVETKIMALQMLHQRVMRISHELNPPKPPQLEKGI